MNYNIILGTFLLITIRQPVQLVDIIPNNGADHYYKVRITSGTKKGAIGFLDPGSLHVLAESGEWKHYNDSCHCTDLAMQFAPGDPDIPKPR